MTIHSRTPIEVWKMVGSDATGPGDLDAPPEDAVPEVTTPIVDADTTEPGDGSTDPGEVSA